MTVEVPGLNMVPLALPVPEPRVAPVMVKETPGVLQLSVELRGPIFCTAMVQLVAGDETVTFCGQVMVGGVLSNTVMICTQVVVLLQLSVAVHVREMMALQGKVPVTTSEKVMTGAGSQLSVAVATPVMDGEMLAPQLTCMFGGHMMTGGTFSVTCTVVVQLLELLHASKTVSVTA